MAKTPPKFPESITVGDDTTGWQVPAARGAAGTVLTSDGAGDATWTVPSGGSIREYGTTLLALRNNVVNLNPTTIGNKTTGSGAHVWADLDSTYHLSYFDMLLIESSGVIADVVAGLRFSTRAEVIAWMSANVPQASGRWDRTVRMRCYDIVDPSIHAPNRIWGSNFNHARLKGPGNRYYDDQNRTADSTSAWSRGDSFLEEVWQKVFGTPHPDAGGMGQESYRCFWFTGRKANFYRCGYEATRTELTSPGSANRRMVTPAGTVTSAQDVDYYQFDTATKVTLACVNGPGTSWALLQDGNIPDDELFTKQQHLALIGYSTTICLGMVDPSGNRMMILKPAGTDSYWLPYLNFSTHRYEYLANFDMQGAMKAHKLGTGVGSSATINAAGPWNLSDFRDAVDGHVMTSNQRPGDIRIQIRDLTTGHISPLSNARIRYYGRRRYVQLSAQVVTPGAP